MNRNALIEDPEYRRARRAEKEGLELISMMENRLEEIAKICGWKPSTQPTQLGLPPDFMQIAYKSVMGLHRSFVAGDDLLKIVADFHRRGVLIPNEPTHVRKDFSGRLAIYENEAGKNIERKD